MSQKISWSVRSAVASAVVGMLAVVAGAGVAYAAVPVLSQASVTVGVQQSVSITSENGTDAYMESNSASNVVSVTTNGTQITLTGISPGSATIVLCGVGTASDCTDLGVTVQTASASSGLSFSQNNLSLGIGNSQSVTISGGNGTYNISSNSNTGVVSTNLSGNTLTIVGVSAGSATIKVCDTTGTTCGALSTTVNSSGSSSSGSGLSFSQNNISLVAGGSQIIDITGGNETYNISNNANASIASVGMSGSGAVIVDGISAGSDSITVCDTSNTNTCGTLSVTITGTTPTTGQAVTFSTANPTLTVGQTLNETLSGGATTYIVLSNQNDNIVQASITGNSTLSLSGMSAGTDSLAVCAIAGGCSTLSVTVTGTGTAAASTPTTSTTGTTTTPTVTTTEPVGTMVANTALLAEIQTLQAAVTQTLTQIESIQTQLNQLEAQVSAGSGGGISTSASAANTGTFTELLTVGSEDAQVTELQQRLTTLGFYSGPITGYYGALTQEAVMKYQTSHGIEATGEVGPDTRTALNAGN